MSMWTLVVAALHVSAHVHSLVQRQGEFVAWMACEELVEVHGLRAMLQPWVEVDAAAALVVRDALGLMGPCCIPWCFPLLPKGAWLCRGSLCRGEQSTMVPYVDIWPQFCLCCTTISQRDRTGRSWERTDTTKALTVKWETYDVPAVLFFAGTPPTRSAHMPQHNKHRATLR